MRAALVATVFTLVACGGKAPPPQQPVANGTPPPIVPRSAVTATAPLGVPREACAQRSGDFGPVPLSPDQLALRRGTGATTFAEIASSVEAPIEVCMPEGQRAWVKRVTCSDGSLPTDASRSASAGPGGTCGSVIDIYIVRCPEREYDVYMDMYMCPAD